MRQTDNTAIVLRYANYRDNDRMLTLFSPTRGRLEVLSRGCRKPRSALVACSELFALGDFELYEKAGRQTLVSCVLTETFYPLRTDYDKLQVGVFLLSLCEAAVQSNVPDQDLFMLLLHTLSRLTFYDQPWRPLTAGFLLHFAACQGFAPDLESCVFCGAPIPEGAGAGFELQEGGLVCPQCGKGSSTMNLSAAQLKWLRMAMHSGSASWVDAPDCHAPFQLLRRFVQQRMDVPLKELPEG